MARYAVELTVKGTALVHNTEQGKDYEEVVDITLGLKNISSQQWDVRRVVVTETAECVWPANA